MKNNSKDSQIELYLDLFSQPCRAIVIFCEIQNIKYTNINTSLMSLEHKSPEYKKNTNPLGTVPALKDKENNFSLAESHTIMRYLSEKFQKYELYPKNNLKKKTEIDFYLDWHLGNVRALLYPYLRGSYIFPIFGIKPTVDLKQIYEQDIPRVLKMIEKIFLKNEDKYLLNSDQLTIADISLYCEVSQFFLQEKSAKNIDLLQKYPKLNKYLEKVKKSHPIFEHMDNIMIKSVQQMTQSLNNSKL